MKNILIQLCFCVLPIIGISQTTWLFDNATGLGDGTSWNDANNWSDLTTGMLHQVPSEGDDARLIINNSTITGNVPNIPANITIGGSKTVTLDLNITIGNGSFNKHGIILFDNAILNIATGRTITINVPTNREAINMNSGKTNTINIVSGATLEVQQCSDGFFIDDPNHNVFNSGTINVTNALDNGINLLRGSFSNSGMLTITSSSTNGVSYAAGTFSNSGTITINGPTVDCIDISGSNFTNTGTMSLTANGTNSSSNCIEVGAGGTCTNNSNGVINANGGTNSNPRAISVAGSLQNLGTITLGGGNKGRTLSNDGGSITNNPCGTIDLTDTRINNNSGTLTNNGFIHSNHPSQGMLSSGTAINNAFYDFANGNWVGTNNGVNVSGGSISYDLADGCILDFNGVNTNMQQFAWASPSVSLGNNNTDGTLNLENAEFATAAGPNTITISDAACTGYNIAFTVQLTNTCDDAVLPIVLSYFRATRKDEEVILDWQTSTEINNDYMAIERSIDGRHFNEIGRLQGAGNSSNTINYQFIDHQQSPGINYYRLRQVDFDGTLTFSKIVSVNINSTQNFIQAYPTAFRNGEPINIQVSENTSSNIELDLIDANGKLILQFQLEGATNQQINTNGLSTGMYLLRCKNGDMTSLIRLVKLN